MVFGWSPPPEVLVLDVFVGVGALGVTLLLGLVVVVDAGPVVTNGDTIGVRLATGLLPLFDTVPLFSSNAGFGELIGFSVRLGFGSLMLICSLKFMQKSPTLKISPFLPEYSVRQWRQMDA